MKTKILAPLFLTLLLAGCAVPKITVPPGSLANWTHNDSYGPWQDSVRLSGVTKNVDGTFTVANYDGQAAFVGFGVHDVITGLVIDGAGQPVATHK